MVPLHYLHFAFLEDDAPDGILDLSANDLERTVGKKIFVYSILVSIIFMFFFSGFIYRINFVGRRRRVGVAGCGIFPRP